MSYAVVLAGITGRIVNDVLSDLRKKYSDGYVFRAAGAQTRSDRLPVYDTAEIAKIVGVSSDAIFGKSARPHGFCRKGDKPCAIKNSSKSDCGRSGEATCFLEKPDNFILIIQEGRREDDVLSIFQYSPLVMRISSDCYDKRSKTLAEVSICIDHAKRVIPGVESNIRTSNSPLLLPPNNFRMNSLKTLMRITSTAGVNPAHVAFRRENFNRPQKAYENNRGILFPPADVNIRHGIPSLQNNPSVAISHEFRLGCRYPRDFQYDVRKVDGKNFDGSMQFICRVQGEIYPKSKYINMTVDDCLL